jgi:hypothetical protein
MTFSRIVRSLALIACLAAVSFAARAAGAGSVNVSSGAIQFGYITTNGTTSTGAWNASLTSGTGVLNVTTLTATGASGTFNFAAPPAIPPSNLGATGTKNVTNGVFSATF